MKKLLLAGIALLAASAAHADDCKFDPVLNSTDCSQPPVYISPPKSRIEEQVRKYESAGMRCEIIPGTRSFNCYAPGYVPPPTTDGMPDWLLYEPGETIKVKPTCGGPPHPRCQ